MYRSLIIALVLFTAACTTSPLGRQQIRFFPEAQMEQMGVTTFQQVRQEMPVADDPALTAYVRCVAQAVTDAIPDGADRWNWEVIVFRQDEPNAFALPGGKIGVHTGILRLAENQDQLAAVVAHEVAHVLAEHPNERVSTAFATQTGLDLLQAVTGGATPQREQLFGLLGLGAQVGVLLPFNRRQETEADLLGLDLMARAGFDPRAAIAFWRNMEQAGGGTPPEFLSTHPSGPTRMADLEARMGSAMAIYRQAVASGARPGCR